MKIILASSNRGKIKEIQELLQAEVVPYKDILGDITIIENGKSFQENAIIKAKAIFERVPQSIVLADDSGISVPALGGEPGIYSARYAGDSATDKENLQKLISKLQEKNIKKTPAFYTAAIAIASPKGVFTTHGWMWGNVIDEARGNKGFGYDPMFIPEGYEKTLGELDEEVKKRISHRAKALRLAKIILERVV
ncbi:XTP/dITP diphosphohydrolase [Nitratiruptor sp. YY08-26]|uniref:RdgB/HAM1 family non-canonical purine NTP pyrophosphatase n=1 Tax=unclassified Nitratiruptor TaxID=2624044 RepID=UPI00191662C6|nr:MULTISPECIES: RdgB/HAM1 family non-canonical purine NTP pyrophosphatase [unclassified Nitratiruptor]BCD62960.1 XTP/dITP diphosphohydrolase [Nitratiruptor sp. YY08-13]BCD66895.1 XTP/dITP diphosphohydrolase [Nitratiruptor sp. YY08-26]